MWVKRLSREDNTWVGGGTILYRLQTGVRGLVLFLRVRGKGREEGQSGSKIYPPGVGDR
jgi:hypothetical protein